MMEREIPWGNRLSTRLGAVLLLVAAAAGGVVFLNLYITQVLWDDSAAIRLTANGPTRVYQMLYLSEELVTGATTDREETRRALLSVAERMDQRYRIMREGDPAAGIPPTTHPLLLRDVAERERHWQTEIRPLVLRHASNPGTETLSQLNAPSRALIQKVEESINLYDRVEREKLQRFRTIQFVLLALIVLSLLGGFLMSRSIAQKARVLAQTADQIAGGATEVTAPADSNDEFGTVAQAFNTMTGRLRAMLEDEQRGRTRLEELISTINDVVNSITSASAEILAATTQQAAGAQEQASAVTETVTTVDEVLQTSEQAAQRARTVAERSQKSADISASGRDSIEETISVIGVVSDQSRSLAADILALAEQAQAIGDIIASVNDIAEQTNILALNAAIEASRAGEHGKGFGVVASEVKALAAQSKKATAQIRQILGQIQKGTNSAVIATEKTSGSVAEATRIVHQAGETIANLAELIQEATTVASQISASSTQQVTGMSQIHQAMKNISQVTHQNLASTRQSEVAAQDLNRVAGRLRELLRS